MHSRAQLGPVGRELQNVVTEAQELLKSAQAEGTSRLDEMSAKVGARYDAARAKLGELQDGAKTAVETTDGYVRSNPWTAVCIAAGVGALFGFVAARR